MQVVGLNFAELWSLQGNDEKAGSSSKRERPEKGENGSCSNDSVCNGKVCNGKVYFKFKTHVPFVAMVS